MRVLLKIGLFCFLSVLLVACSTVSSLVSGTSKAKVVSLNPQLTLTENIGEPVAGKQAEWLTEKIKTVSQELTKIHGARIFTLRDDQVIKVMIPASVLFLPNDTILKPTVSETLTPILSQVKSKEFDLIVAGYMDDSGRADYTHKITKSRANATVRWFAIAGIEPTAMITYAFGSEHPRRPNTSTAFRAENRRIEFILIPSQTLLHSRKSGIFR